ncbi:MAG: GNAT family N-acetyltransferase [Rhodospirillales bacterium]
MTYPPFILRPPTFEDVVPYTNFLADPDVSAWLDDSAQVAVSPARVEAILLREAWCLWSIECEDTFVGVASLYEPDLARGVARYSIVIGDRKYWGQGLGTAVTRQVMAHAFMALGLRKVVSDILEPNTAARVIHERAGFAEEGRLRQNAWRDGEWVDCILMSLLHQEWRQRNSSE